MLPAARLALGSWRHRWRGNRVLINAFEEKSPDLGQACFGVPLGRGVIAIDVAEVALPVDQGIPRGKILSEAHQRIIDRLIAVRMEIAHHVADDLGGFLEPSVGVEAQQAHAVEDAAMNRLEPVARIRQRAMHDRGECVGEIALLERVAQRNILDIAAAWRWGNQLLTHAPWVARE